MCIIGNRKESGWRVILEGCGGVSFTTRLLIYNLHPHLVVWRATLSHINVIRILYKWKEWNEATLHNVDFGTCFSSYLTMRRVSVIAERQGVVVLKERSRFFGNMVRNLWRKRTSRYKNIFMLHCYSLRLFFLLFLCPLSCCLHIWLYSCVPFLTPNQINSVLWHTPAISQVSLLQSFPPSGSFVCLQSRDNGGEWDHASSRWKTGEKEWVSPRLLNHK